MKTKKPNEGMLTEALILRRLRSNIKLPSLNITVASESPPRQGPDATLVVEWQELRFEFDVEVKARSTPIAFESAQRQARIYSQESRRLPMIVLPYLSNEQLEQLETTGISGIDMCGNGIITVPGRLLVYRSGCPNKFRDSSTTKNAYRGATSLIPRVFLCQRRFETVSQIREEIVRRGGSITLSTVSKVLRRMEEDVLIRRDGGEIKLVQPDAVLDKLAASYQPPKTRETMALSVRGPILPALKAMMDSSRAVLSGTSSVDRYAVMGRGDCPIVYCVNAEETLASFGDLARTTDRFADLQLYETDDRTVFFDARVERGVRYASPIQTYLELSKGDKRDQDAAQQVRERILKQLPQEGLGGRQ